MRQFAAVLILIALFILLVGARFKPSDGDKLSSVSRIALFKVRDSLPPAARMAGPLQLLRRGIPERLEDKVRARLEADAAGEVRAVPEAGQGSHMLSGLARAQGLVVLPPGTSLLPEGTSVPLHRLEWFER